ncbi:MAG: hypothetical protein HY960_06535 [Ignavibacteriae bacterium]|nr:hypothetical protein [Ignavibacteriota bacterium]
MNNEYVLKTHWMQFLILAIAGIVVYSSGLMNPYYADDYKFIFESPSTKLFHYFTNENGNAAWYRPMEAMVLSAIQSLFGLNPIPIHLIVLFFHIVVALCVMVFMETSGFSTLSATIASVFMLVSQANALAVLSIDTLSQVGGTLFGCLALWFLWRFHKTRKSPRGIFLYMFSLLTFIWSLWMKETSLGFLVAVGCLFIFKAMEQKSWLHIFHQAKLFFPFALIAIVYLFVRAYVITKEPAARYSIEFGINIIQNSVMLMIAATTAISSVSVFQAFQNKELTVLVLTSFTSITLVATVAYGVWKSGRKKEYLGLLILAFTILLPAILISHVSELYVYSAMPLLSCVIGAGLASSYQNGKRLLRTGLLIVGVTFLVLHVTAIQTKASLMKENGNRATYLLKQVVPFVFKVPENGTLVLVTPQSREPEYSVFIMHGLNVFRHGENIFNYISLRKDFKTYVVNERDLNTWIPPDSPVLLTLQGNPPTVVLDSKDN